ncbi:MAG: 7-cyano-7-deazaguanine synthase QueC [Candidatus Gastranaerophilales bacterium]|nr:7-cyano-7-deazaguanine synthase QueC [Candidatus Gastranaerophilales bacterium]
MKKMMNKKSVILLSGGLDSVVSLGTAKDDYNIELALTFNYGQKSAGKEISAAKKIADYYKVEHKVIEIPFLKQITKTSLVSSDIVPSKNLGTLESAGAVWVPNRNGLFLNIAASFADTYKFSHIIFGANKEEGQTFPDNTREFVNAVNESFKYSTLVRAKVEAPLINCDKNDIVNLALRYSVPLEMVRSCYNSGEKNCGTCESCRRLKSALEHNNAHNYIERLF